MKQSAHHSQARYFRAIQERLSQGLNHEKDERVMFF